MPSKKILIFIDWYYPAFKAGGPVKSIFNLTKQLSKEFEFHIITSNQDVDGSFLDVIKNQWTIYDSVKVIYLEKLKQNKTEYKKLYNEINPDWVYYNSLFSYSFTILPFLIFRNIKNSRHLIAPRGMLGKGALSLKPLKKKVFLFLSKYFLFKRNNTYWHSTSEEEKLEIQLHYGTRSKIRQAQNLSSSIFNRGEYKKKKDSLSLVFISRISAKKNLYYLLEVMEEFDNKSITLDIYGPKEDLNYWKSCEKVIENNPKIHYKGILKPNEISSSIQNYDFYILPTLHENYGHSIVEAFTSLVPVIISNNTPWKDLNKKLVGKELDLYKPETWKETILEYSKLDNEAYQKMINACESFARKEILDPLSIRDTEKLFLYD